MTGMGVILGTAAYMAPEQAQGQDRRQARRHLGVRLRALRDADWAGARSTGETLSDIVAAVLKNEPDWTALPAETPAAIRALLRRCLRKDPTRRLHDSADARIEIDDAIAQPTPQPQATDTSRRRGSLQALGWLVAALLAIALLVTRIGPPGPPSSSPQAMRLELNMPPGVEASETATPNMAISPDGTRVAFIGSVGGVRRIYVRRLGEFESTVVRGTETVNICSFSPDGGALVFIASDRILKKVSVSDGLVTPLVGDVDYSVGGGVWGRDERITFVRAGTLWRVSANGGPAEQLTTLDAAQKASWRTCGQRPLQTRRSCLRLCQVLDRVVTRIESLSLVTKERRVVIDAGSNPLYAASGHLLFFRDGAIVAAPFDAARLQVTGPAVSVLKDISLDQFGAPLLTISGAGSLAYIPAGQATKRLVWVTRQGVEQPITDVTRPYKNPRLSPDGQRIVVEVAGGDLWIQDVKRSTFTKLTTG